MKQKIGITILLIYTSFFGFVLLYFYAPVSAYMKNPDRQVWLSSFVVRDEVYVRVDADDMFSQFIGAVGHMYGGAHLILPPDLFRLEDLTAAGVTVSVTSTSRLGPCTDQALAQYRRTAAVSLLYTPLGFSSITHQIISRWPLLTEPSIGDRYPLTMLLVPNKAKEDSIVAVKCFSYLVFVPATMAEHYQGIIQ